MLGGGSVGAKSLSLGSNKTRSAPLGATSRLELNQLGRTFRLYVAPNGAGRVFVIFFYKYAAPTEPTWTSKLGTVSARSSISDADTAMCVGSMPSRKQAP